MAQIVGEILITDEASLVEQFIENLDSKFKSGTTISGPGVLIFFGMTIEQSGDYSSTICAEAKLNSLGCCSLFVFADVNLTHNY